MYKITRLCCIAKLWITHFAAQVRIKPYLGCFSWETFPRALEENQHLQHDLNSSTVATHCVQYVDEYIYCTFGFETYCYTWVVTVHVIRLRKNIWNHLVLLSLTVKTKNGRSLLQIQAEISHLCCLCIAVRESCIISCWSKLNSLHCQNHVRSCPACTLCCVFPSMCLFFQHVFFWNFSVFRFKVSVLWTGSNRLPNLVTVTMQRQTYHCVIHNRIWESPNALFPQTFLFLSYLFLSFFKLTSAIILSYSHYHTFIWHTKCVRSMWMYTQYYTY